MFAIYFVSGIVLISPYVIINLILTKSNSMALLYLYVIYLYAIKSYGILIIYMLLYSYPHFVPEKCGTKFLLSKAWCYSINTNSKIPRGFDIAIGFYQ